MSDTYSSDAPSFGGVPANYASPEQMQRAYFNLLRNRNRQQKALSAYYHPLAAVADVVEAASDQLQINRMMGAARQSTEAGAATVPDLPPILSGDADTPSVGHPDQPPQGQFSPTTNHADIGQQPTDPHLDPKFANAVMQIESRGDVNARSGSNRGLFQWSPDLERRYGINDQNRTDPTAQYRAFNRANVD